MWHPEPELEITTGTMLAPRKRLHGGLSKTRQSPEGKLSFELGVKVGFWPCLDAPFISLMIGFRRLDIWYGKPSYWPKGEPPRGEL